VGPAAEAAPVAAHRPAAGRAGIDAQSSYMAAAQHGFTREGRRERKRSGVGMWIVVVLVAGGLIAAVVAAAL
jgi:hypothetical protein